MKSKILGTGSYLPEKILTNIELSTMMDTSDEWITARTGISERRISSGESTWEMSLKASLKAIENANIKPSDLDYIISSSVTPDFLFPSVSCILQGKLGAENAFGIDMNTACSGFVMGLDMADNYIKCGKAKNILVVSGECLSKIVNYKDRATSILFGDGAGAVVITAVNDDDISGIVDSVNYCDGKGAELLVCRSTKQKTIFSFRRPAPLGKKVINKKTLAMDGNEVFKFAVSVVPKLVGKIFERNAIKSDDLAFFIPHQANIRIIQSAIRKAGIPESKTIINLQKYGNTSSASVSICLDELQRSGKLMRGDKILLSAFGAGLTAGAMLIEW